ncbi:MAG: lysophospholipid acyltransferase family protein [Planctomycetota bacterium]|jgi:KDO2-lipid IV(A) lauroyltransferase
MARNQSKLTIWSQYLALRAAGALLHSFGIRRNLKSARGIASMLYNRGGRHRVRAEQNIRRAMPELSEDQVQQIARGSYQHALQFAVEVMFTTRLIQEGAWADRVQFKGMEEVMKLILSDRPTILVTGHYGNWEVLGYVMGLLGIDVSSVARPLDNPLINDWAMGVREQKGMRIISKFGATDEMVEVMERGGTLGFIGDQNAGDKGMFVPFFNRLASAYKSIGLLAIRYDAPVVCGYAIRRGDDFTYDAGAMDIIYPEQWKSQPDPLYYLTARYTRALENMVYLAPEQYLWIHRRWKSRPRHERLDKPMPTSLQKKLEALPWMTEQGMAALKEP